jgi:hypothetical protein
MRFCPSPGSSIANDPGKSSAGLGQSRSIVIFIHFMRQTVRCMAELTNFARIGKRAEQRTARSNPPRLTLANRVRQLLRRGADGLLKRE